MSRHTGWCDESCTCSGFARTEGPFGLDLREPDLDPRFQWEAVYEFGSFEPTHLRVGCNHLNRVPVTLRLTGELVAQLCLDCDEQLVP